MKELTLDDYIQGIKKQDRAILARAITLVESTKAEHQELSQKLLKAIYPLTGNAKRVGISGTPGVGKSTFIENFGMYLINHGEKLAVLAIDPSSQITGGSILGDKTRMQLLSSHQNAFIRPSANGTSLGGIAAKTTEAMLLCDAFGFDTIFIETVGVGQSEVAVANIVDFFILLMQPGSGDELQGIKRGILEVSDLVVVNKADGNQLAQAKIAKHDYQKSLEVLKEKNQWKTPVILCSSLEKTGFEEINKVMNQFYEKYFDKTKRNTKTKIWLKELLIQKFKAEIHSNQSIDKKIDELIKNEDDLFAGVESLYKSFVK